MKVRADEAKWARSFVDGDSDSMKSSQNTLDATVNGTEPQKPKPLERAAVYASAPW